jgi:hypothetical protein
MGSGAVVGKVPTAVMGTVFNVPIEPSRFACRKKLRLRLLIAEAGPVSKAGAKDSV